MENKKNNNMKVTYMAFDKVHEEIFPKSMELGDFANHMRGICNTWVLVDIQPTSRDLTININIEE